METIRKTFVYRLKPTSSQAILFARFAGAARYIFNYGLRVIRGSRVHRCKNKGTPGFPRFKKKGDNDSFRSFNAPNLNLKLCIKQEVASLANNKALRAMSYNIRMAPLTEDDGTENAWEYRLPKIAMIFTKYAPCIIGLQEMSSSQMESLKNTVDSSYVFLGKYPTRKPIESGLGIVYNSNKLQAVTELHTVWLNEIQTTPNAPAWDGSHYERYIIYAKFKNLVTDRYFWFVTTHFDHLGIQARQESAKIIMDLAESLDTPAIVTGDFNCFPQLGGRELYQLLCTHSKKIKDSGNITQKLFGVPGSWIGWDYDFYKQKEGYAKYDFIFVHDSIKVLQHGIIDDRVWDSRFQKELYPSDHRPVLSDLLI